MTEGRLYQVSQKLVLFMALRFSICEVTGTPIRFSLSKYVIKYNFVFKFKYILNDILYKMLSNNILTHMPNTLNHWCCYEVMDPSPHSLAYYLSLYSNTVGNMFSVQSIPMKGQITYSLFVDIVIYKSDFHWMENSKYYKTKRYKIFYTKINWK